jgi:hypothetical protein
MAKAPISVCQISREEFFVRSNVPLGTPINRTEDTPIAPCDQEFQPSFQLLGRFFFHSKFGEFIPLAHPYLNSLLPCVVESYTYIEVSISKVEFAFLAP